MPIFVKIIIIAAAAVIGIVSTVFMKMKHDNAVEEIAEYVIKDQTGYDLDLSPDSPEEDQE